MALLLTNAVGVPQLLLLLAIFIYTGTCQSTGTGCPSSPSCDSTGTQCYGFGDLSIKCVNGTVLRFGTCYLSDLCQSAAADQANDWIRITANNIDPKQCYAYSTNIKQNVLTAYNSWCCLGDNYQRCCPGSTAWPTDLPRSPANCAAMQTADTEVAYVAASGSATQTMFLLQLRPQIDSPMCSQMLYGSDNSSVGDGGGGGGDGTGSDAGSTTAATVAAIVATNSSTNSNAGTTAATPGAVAATSNAIATTTTPTSSTTAAAVATNSNTTATPARGTTSRISRRKREAWPEDKIVDSFNIPEELASVADRDQLDVASSRHRGRRDALTTITLDTQTVKLLITGINLQNIVVTTIATASNGTIAVTVIVTQNVSPASTMSPDRQSKGWAIATGTICGVLAALVCVYLIACVIHRSKSKGDRLPL